MRREEIERLTMREGDRSITLEKGTRCNEEEEQLLQPYQDFLNASTSHLREFSTSFDQGFQGLIAFFVGVALAIWIFMC